jgi:methanol--5-hydroxybenzimidazolylcobamide Co-methyltransferase
MKFKELKINKADNLIFGTSPNPVKTPRGLTIGAGIVYPELNFTLPPIEVSKKTQNSIVNQYRQIVVEALERALDLHSNGLILEFETVIEMTKHPEMGIEIVKVMNDICEDYYAKHKLKTEIRLTPNDLRDFDRPPKQRTSGYLPAMLELFENGAKNGGNLLSIESTGGKEVSDDALLNCNIKQFIFSQAVLGVRDMDFLWSKIIEIAKKTDALPGGDTACGFGNTAMVLAEKKYIPRVFAAIARIVTVVRTLVAVEKGATGPDKDCGYEGPFLKAITGIPISMEGKTAACAHFSPLGNISSACADLWSNESVQNIKLLAGMAPTVYLEQLEYDCRLMNEAIKQGRNQMLNLQKLMVESDAVYDPQALILAPKNVLDISKSIIAGRNYIDAAVKGAFKGLEIIENAFNTRYLKLSEMEVPWIQMLRTDLESIPTDEDKLIDEVMATIEPGKVLLQEYGL